MDEHQIYVVCLKSLIKTIKTALESCHRFPRDSKILSIHGSASLIDYIVEEDFLDRDSSTYIIPTAAYLDDPLELLVESVKNSRTALLLELGIEHYSADVFLAVRITASSGNGEPSPSKIVSKKGQLAGTVFRWLLSLPDELRSSLAASASHLISLSSWTYTIYPPMLLLPPTTFSSPPWPTLLETLLSPQLPALYQLICSSLHVSHIGINAPIPLTSSTSTTDRPVSNILRSPKSFKPLHGAFGSVVPKTQPSTSSDFATAFWCNTRQHSIYQSWAPLYTMFSRGNISEKHRVLHMRELTKEILGKEPSECSAVDLYAGIGYFAFSYAKAGIGKVFCWEINGWSVEGLKRGAQKNGWSVTVVKEDTGEDELTTSINERLIVFQEDNRRASKRIQRMRGHIAPVRHVNCGFLPSSNDSWQTAIDVLDPLEGGWIHAHENIAVKDIEARKAEIVAIFNHMVEGGRSTKPPRKVECQHVQRVKTYAPGVMHCVLDIFIARLTTP